MTESDAERFSHASEPFLRSLTRSALLDRPRQGAQGRVLDRVLAAEHGVPGRSFRFGAAIGAVAGLAAGAVVALLVAHSIESPSARLVTPEPAGSAPARVAPVTPSAAPTPSALPPLPPCPRVVVAAGRVPLLDDFEDDNARVFAAEGRAGTWRMNGAAGTKLTPPAGTLAFPLEIPGGRTGSRRGVHFSGARFKQGAAGLFTELAPGRCYDASVYAGFEFFAKGKSRIRFQLTMIDVMEKRWGGLCDSNCYDAHYKAFELSPDFTRYEVRWAEVEQMGYGKPVPFDPRRLLSVDFSVDAADTPFDVWIDDVEFLER